MCKIGQGASILRMLNLIFEELFPGPSGVTTMGFGCAEEHPRNFPAFSENVFNEENCCLNIEKKKLNA